jgi:nitrite reductase/ring-hydroxylating ferredoxin subunit
MQFVDFAITMKRHAVAKMVELPPGGRKIVAIGKTEIGLFNVAGEIRAYRNVCPHAGAPVCAGRISGTSMPSKVYEYVYGMEGRILRCPWHGWEFDLKTGEHIVDPENRLKEIVVETESLERYPTEQAEGNLYVLMPG